MMIESALWSKLFTLSFFDLTFPKGERYVNENESCANERRERGACVSVGALYPQITVVKAKAFEGKRPRGECKWVWFLSLSVAKKSFTIFWYDIARYCINSHFSLARWILSWHRGKKLSYSIASYCTTSNDITFLVHIFIVQPDCIICSPPFLRPGRQIAWISHSPVSI